MLLFENEQGEATWEAPIVSDSFDVLGPKEPVTVSCEGLGRHEIIEIRKWSNATSAYVPFWVNGNQVSLSYSNTVVVIHAKGTYALFITKKPKNPVSAEWDK